MFGLTQLEERLVWIVLAVLIVLGFSWHERRIGAAGCELNVKAADAAAEVKEEKQHSADVGTVQKEGTTYAVTIAAPVLPAPIIRLCPDLHVPPLQASAVGGPETHAEAADRGEDSGQPATWDSTPVVRAGRDADAQIAGLQDYILKVCRPK
jgi:hypothetical protein